MGNFWLKAKVVTKIVLFAILSIAVLIFTVQNINKPVTLWLWNDIQTTLLKVLLATALISAIFTFLLGTALRTVRQIRELRARNRGAALEREVADMKAKAAMLKTKPATGAEPLRADPALSDVDPEERS
ncbi:MAG TPA: hypothetical protein VER17_19485 [Tepidisphaeraceae bacterium]|nr:hypothetical protein [Tepidisphaeraceae bacterium]